MNKFKLGFLAVALLSSSAFADTTSANFQSSATLTNSCVVSTTNIDFGVLTATPNQSQSTITSRCTRGTIYNFNISAGNSADYTARSLKASTQGNNDVVLYNLYTDNSYASDKVWKDTGWGMGSLVTGTGSEQTFTVYAKVGTNQHLVKPDSYSDTLTLTLYY